MCCELLSFFSIFGIHNNQILHDHRLYQVVNCFHFSVSLGYTTTGPCVIGFILKLWIAFIFQYLWDTQQLVMKIPNSSACCELLSFFSIFGIHNNQGKILEIPGIVVNCFHFSVSLGYTTTFFKSLSVSLVLWIAFIFQYLWDTQQQRIANAASLYCCELLSFFSIFGIHNNNHRLEDL